MVLQALARRTIEASYRSFLADEVVDGFIGSGASDDHIETHLHQGHVHCMEVDGEVVGLTNTAARAFYEARGWLVSDRLESDAGERIELVKRREATDLGRGRDPSAPS